MGYCVTITLAPARTSVTKEVKKRRVCLLEYPTIILSLKYNVNQAKVNLNPRQ